MSDNFYKNNYNYNNLRHSQFYQNEKKYSQFHQKINPFSQNMNLKKVNSEPISSLNQNGRNTVSNFPFPRDSILENDISNEQFRYIPLDNKITL